MSKTNIYAVRTIVADLATQDQLVELLASGSKVMDATAEGAQA